MDNSVEHYWALTNKTMNLNIINNRGNLSSLHGCCGDCFRALVGNRWRRKSCMGSLATPQTSTRRRYLRLSPSVSATSDPSYPMISILYPIIFISPFYLGTFRLEASLWSSCLWWSNLGLPFPDHCIPAPGQTHSANMQLTVHIIQLPNHCPTIIQLLSNNNNNNNNHHHHNNIS